MTDTEPGRVRPVERAEALRLLGSVPYGRIVFTLRGLPAVRPVNHLVDGEDVIVRTHTRAAVLRAVGGVVAYQADLVSTGPRLEWSVVAIGVLMAEDRAEAVERYERMLVPSVDLPMDHVLRIRPELVSGQVRDTHSSGAGASA